ncbi:MAG: hypothetical protein AAGU78_04930, partial [Chloroflexota bacterium]
MAPQQTPQIIVVTGVTPTAPPGGADVLLEAVIEPGTLVAGAVNTPVPTPTATPTPTALPTATPFGCLETTGRIVEETFTSAILGGDVPYTMYQPPCFFDTWRRYPYVILLHGTGYDEQMWADLGVAEAL